jgi:hypothetical protein
MKRTTMVGLCVTGALAIFSVAATSASAALPEYSGPFPKPITSKSGPIVIETVSGVKATCTRGTNTGEITGPKTGTVTLRLVGCEVLNVLKCNSPGAAPGEIVSSQLSSTLGYINKTKREVGVDLEAPAGTTAEFECGTNHVVVSGSIIGKITPVNRKVKAGSPFILKFTQTGGKQNPSKFEGGPTDVPMGSINGGPPEEAGVSARIEITLAEAAEIKG